MLLADYSNSGVPAEVPQSLMKKHTFYDVFSS